MGNNSCNFIWDKICHHILKNVGKCFNLPIRVMVTIKVLKPREIGHAPLKVSRVCPGII